MVKYGEFENILESFRNEIIAITSSLCNMKNGFIRGLKKNENNKAQFESYNKISESINQYSRFKNRVVDGTSSNVKIRELEDESAKL